jgi:peptide/nickel transport system substrate-binding protein
MTWENPEPVGCGPLAFEGRNRKERIDFARFDSHPINRDEGSLLNAQFSPVAFSDLRFQIVSSDANTLDLIDEDMADLTTPDLRSSVVSRIARSDNKALLVTPSRTVYHVGFNTRKRPMRNPNFRRAVAQVLDKQNIANELFDGFADPIASPLIDNTWLPQSLQWRGSDPEVPFIGSDGTLDVEAARKKFTEAGFVYTDDEELIYG